MEDWKAIEQIRAAVADIERLRADTLQLLHESSAFLDQIDRINRPLISMPTGKEQTSREISAARDVEQLRARGERMLELATRAYCEQNYDFARLLTQLATEVFAHARDVQESHALSAAPADGRLRAQRRHRA